MTPFSDIRIYDRNLDLIHVCPVHISSDWQLAFQGYGTGEVHLPKTEEMLNILREHTYLFLSQGSLQGIVTGVRVENDCALFIKTPEWFLEKFLLTDFVPKKSTKGAVLCEIVETSMPDVAIEIIGEEQDETPIEEMSFSGTKTVLEMLKSCISGSNTGFSLSFSPENKQFSFRVYQGMSRKNTVLSEEMRTLYHTLFTKELQDSASGGVYYKSPQNGGMWNPNTNTPHLSYDSRHYGMYYTVTEDSKSNILGRSLKKGDVVLCGDPNGKFSVYDRPKDYAVVIPPKETGIFAWSAKLSSETEEEAQQELNEKCAKETIEGETKNLIYGTDFCLGDKVTAVFSQGNFCMRQEQTVVGVHIWQNEMSCGCLPITSGM